MRPLSFSTLPLLITALLAAPGLPHLSAKPLAPKSELVGFAKGPWQLPTRGFSLSLPNSWVAQKDGPAHRVLSCALKGKGKVQQIILVQMGVSQSPTLQGHADGIAEGGKAHLLGGTRQLDKKPALVLKLSGQVTGLTKSWAQQRFIVTRQGKQTFTIAILASADQKIDSTVEAVFRGWKWQPFAAPSQHLQLKPKPDSFSQGRFNLRLPEIMWPVSPRDSGMEGTLMAIYDARTGISALTMSANIVPSSKILTLSVMRRNFATNVRQRLSLSHDLVWQEFPGQPARTLSRFFEVPAPFRETGYSSFTAYGLVKMPRNQWAVVTFTMTGQEAPARALYAATAQKMFASVRLGAT